MPGDDRKAGRDWPFEWGEPPRDLVTSDRRFPASERLKRPVDFDAVFRSGQFFRHPLFTLVVANGGTDHRRVGFSVGKRVGGAVLRNRLKRRLRALYAEYRDHLPKACDCVIVARPEAARTSAAPLAAAIRRTFSRAGRLAGGRTPDRRCASAR